MGRAATRKLEAVIKLANTPIGPATSTAEFTRLFREVLRLFYAPLMVPSSTRYPGRRIR